MAKNFNLDYAVSLTIRDKQDVSNYAFHEEVYYRNIIFGKKKKHQAGIYEEYYGGFTFICTIDKFDSTNLSKKYQIIDKIVYLKPSITIIFVNNGEKTLYFDNLEKCEEEYQKLKEKINPISGWL